MTNESEHVTAPQLAGLTTAHQLAHVLRQLRRRQARRAGAAELTYRELAARTGWSIGIIAGYFSGRTLPPTDRFDILVTQLGATPAERGALATARDRIHEGRRRYDPPAAGWPVPRQLPSDGCRFTGRAGELARLDTIGRAPGSIVVLTGTAGVGKTAMAVHWAHRAAKRFPDGQLYVNLRGFDPGGAPMSPAEAVREFLDSFGVAAQQVPASTAAQISLYRSLLAGRRLLVILDNARDAEQIRPLLPGSPGCMTLVTSRDALSGVVAVDGAHSLTLDVLPFGEAHQLLARRLGALWLDVAPDVAHEVVDRCARLPLALAITAARASSRPTFPLAVLAEELRDAQGSLDSFHGGDDAADARIAFSCSYRHLSPTAALLFRLLGTHCGPDIGAPAAASLAGVPLAQARPALAELARAHLVTEHAPGRYMFHDLLRAFAAEQAARVETDAQRHAATRRGLAHYLHTAHAAALLLYPDRDPIPLPPPPAAVTPEPLHDREQAGDWLRREHRVLLAAVRHAALTGHAASSWQLAWSLADYLDWRGHWHDLVSAQSVALDAAAHTADRAGQAHSHRQLARAYVRLNRLDDAQSHLDRAIHLARETGDRATEAGGRLSLSLVLERRGHYRSALDHSRQALAVFEATGHRAGQAKALNAVGWYHALLGDHEQAVTCCHRALALHAELGSSTDLAPTLDTLGYAQHHLGRHQDAAASYERAAELYRRSGDRYHEADTLIHLGDVHHAAGDAELATAVRQQALDVLSDLHHPRLAELRGARAG